MILNTRTKLAIARALNRSLLCGRSLVGLGTKAQVRRHGIVWDLDLEEGIDLSIYLFGCFEPMTARALRRLAKSGDIVLDIGANIGAHTLPLAKAVGSTGRVFAFEPTDYAFSKLIANLRLNEELGCIVIPEQVMLTASSGIPVKASLYSSWPLRKYEDLHRHHQGRLMPASHARCESLDDYIERQGLDRISLIKLDVDGHEVPVLKGASEALKRCGPPIVMEIAPYVHEEENHSFEELIDILRSHEYRLRPLNQRNFMPMEAKELQRRIPPGAGMNIVAERLAFP